MTLSDSEEIPEVKFTRNEVLRRRREKEKKKKKNKRRWRERGRRRILAED